MRVRTTVIIGFSVSVLVFLLVAYNHIKVQEELQQNIARQVLLNANVAIVDSVSKYAINKHFKKITSENKELFDQIDKLKKENKKLRVFAAASISTEPAIEAVKPATNKGNCLLYNTNKLHVDIDAVIIGMNGVYGLIGDLKVIRDDGAILYKSKIDKNNSKISTQMSNKKITKDNKYNLLLGVGMNTAGIYYQVGMVSPSLDLWLLKAAAYGMVTVGSNNSLSGGLILSL